MRNKHAKSVTRFSSGPRCAPDAMNTAPAVAPAKSVGGYGALRKAGPVGGAAGPGTSGPSQRSSASGYGLTGSGAPGSVPGGGSSMSGPGITKGGGTSSPTQKPGPSGLGETGTKFAW